MTEPIQPKRTHVGKHYPALDGLRGLAVLLVMIHHFVRDYPVRGSFHTFAVQATLSFWTGVDLFFVLSGFLITGILIDARDGQGYFRIFYGRRILRIFPVYYGVLFFVFAILPMIHLAIPYVGASQAIYLGTFTTNIALATGHWFPGALDVYWSLAVEEQFYLLWPLLILLLPESRRISVILAGLIAAACLRYVFGRLGTSEFGLFAMLPTHPDGLLIGALIATSIRTKSELPTVGTRGSLLLLCLIGTFLIFGSFHVFGILISHSAWSLREAVLYYPIIGSAFGLLLYLALLPSNPVQKLFSTRILRWFGKYSYALYVIHRLIAALIALIFHKFGTDVYLSSLPPWRSDIVYLGLFFSISIAVAWLSWRYVEQPFLRLKRFLPYSFTERTISTSGATA